MGEIEVLFSASMTLIKVCPPLLLCLKAALNSAVTYVQLTAGFPIARGRVCLFFPLLLVMFDIMKQESR